MTLKNEGCNIIDTIEIYGFKASNVVQDLRFLGFLSDKIFGIFLELYGLVWVFRII